MNKQRKVLITTTYNEMGIIIDTKAEEVAQPNLQPTCNQLATDTISRQAAIDAVRGRFSMPVDNLIVEVIGNLPSADVQPVRETAEWVYGEKDGADGWYCSKCGFHIPWYYDYYGLKNIDFIRDFRTCPHCDAKMLKYTGMKGEWNV